MSGESNHLLKRPPVEPAIQAYFLGRTEYEAVLSLQQRLVYEVAGGASPHLILCEHAPIVTVGRHGSRNHLFFDETGPRDRRWPIRWINRGSGCWLQLPGQIAWYAVMPLRNLGLTVPAYLDRLHQVMVATLADFSVVAEHRPGSPNVWSGGRPIACIGIAVRHWVAYFGGILNLNPLLDPFRLVRTGKDDAPMTSLERERRGAVRPALVRAQLLHHFADRFGFASSAPPALFTDHPWLGRKAAIRATTAAR